MVCFRNLSGRIAWTLTPEAGTPIGFGEGRGRIIAAADFAAGRLLLSNQRAWDK
jgi:hypothetical protein